MDELGGVGMREMRPRGHYSAREVGRLAGVSGQKVGQWARNGYIRSSQSDGPPRIYSYQDVAEAMVVHALVDDDVDYPTIKATIEWLRKKYGHDWPLQHAQLQVPSTTYVDPRTGRTIPKRVIAAEGIDTAKDHPLLHEEHLVEIATDLRRGGWAAREAGDLRHIEVDPDRLSGRPVIAGLRVPAEDVARLAQREGGRKILRDEYGLTDEQVDDAVSWWQTASAYDRAS